MNENMFLKPVTIHKTNGRIRFKYLGLRYLKSDYNEIGKKLCNNPFITGVTFNAITETILIYHIEKRHSTENLIDVLNYVLEPYSLKAYVEDKTKQASSQLKNVQNEEIDSTLILKRLALSALTIGLGNTVLKSIINIGFIPGTILGKFTTIPSLVALGLTSNLYKSALNGVVKDKMLNADFLTVTSIFASILLGQSYSALTIVMLSDIAEYMTSHTIERTRKSIKDLLSLDEPYAWKTSETGELIHCPIEELKIDDKIVIHTGEKISVDGTVVSGQALVDQSSTTGEFLPVICKLGDKVLAGTLIKSGVITVIAEKVGDDTVVSRIIDMVENIDSKKAPMQHYADQFSNYLVPLNFLAALTIYLVTKKTDQALKMLVIDYSCGIKLSTATAFSAAINAAVKKGILIKGGAKLEMMSRTNTIIFDKTGTMTEGKPEITTVKIIKKSYSENDVIGLACAAEETSSHPLASAILDYGMKIGADIPLHTEIETVVSKGSITYVNDKCIRVGSKRYMLENKISIPKNASVSPELGTPIYVSEDNKLIGVICAMDKPRANMRRTLNSLRSKGVNEISMLTGDSTEQAQFIASKLGVDSFKAGLLPEHKAEEVLKLQANGNHVVMVGDGINDALALSYSDVGISLGSKSTDVAMETSDVIINRNDPMLISKVKVLADDTMKVVRQNFGIVIAINTLGLLLGAASNISVFWSAVLHNMSTIAVVSNSCRLLLYGRRNDK